MTIETEETLAEREPWRVHVAALEGLVTLLIRRMALDSPSAVAELDGFKERALKEAWGLQLEYSAPADEIAERIDAIISNAETRLNWMPPG